MKISKIALVAALWAAFLLPAQAQWQVPDHSIPVGRGSGTGFRSVAPGASNTILQSPGNGSDPAFTTFPLAMLGLCGTENAFPVYYGGVWTCSTASAPLAAVLNGTMNLNPLAASSQRGINITTSGPTTSTAGAIYSNYIQGSWNSPLTGTTTPGTPDCQCWSMVQMSASTGPSFDGVESYGLAVGNVTGGANTTSSDVVAMSSGVYTNYAWPNARFYGGTSAATVGASGTSSTLIGLEVAASIANSTPGAVPDRLGVNAISYETNRPSGFDAAFTVSGGNSGGQFKNALGLYTKGGTLANALPNDGNIIYAETAQTINSVISVPLLDISSYVIDTKHAKLTGGGVLALGDATTAAGIGLKGGAGDNIGTTYTFNSVDKWTFGATASAFYVTSLAASGASISINQSSGVVSTPSGLSVAGSFSAPSLIHNADLSAGTYSNITGTGTLTAGATGAGFNVALGASTVTGVLAASNGGTGVANSANLTVSSATSVGRGQYQGTNTNDNAAAGNVGEVIESTVASGSAISLTTSTDTTVTSVTLTAGDWDCWGNVAYSANGSTVTLVTAGWINTVTNSAPSLPASGAYTQWVGSATGFAPVTSAGKRRISTTGQTIYLGTNAIFNTSTLSAYGYLACRRER